MDTRGLLPIGPCPGIVDPTGIGIIGLFNGTIFPFPYTLAFLIR